MAMWHQLKSNLCCGRLATGVAAGLTVYSCVLLTAGGEEGAKKKAGAASLEHGVFQLRQMFMDRKQMTAYADVHGRTMSLTEKDTIFTWMAERFQGLNTGTRVVWDAASPEPGHHADHSIAIMGQPASIRLKDLTYLDGLPNACFEKLWHAAVFEMFNLENQTDFAHLFDLAAKGLIERPNFVNEAARLEYRAILKTRVFYQDSWLKWAAKNSLDSDRAIWDHGWRPDFDDWLSSHRKAANGYPESHFQSLFDWCKSHYKRYLEHSRATKPLEKNRRPSEQKERPF